MTDPRIEAAAKAWDLSMGGRYHPHEVEELGDEVAAILTAVGIDELVARAEAAEATLARVWRKLEDTWPDETQEGVRFNAMNADHLREVLEGNEP